MRQFTICTLKTKVMETTQTNTYSEQPLAGQLKESTRDMVRLQRDYQLPDELFWQIFNTRVLLNQPIDINAFLSGLHSGRPGLTVVR